MKPFEYYISETTSSDQAVLSFLYKNLFSLVTAWANSAVGSRPMMAACLHKIPQQVQQDRVADFLFGEKNRWQRCTEYEPVTKETTTWVTDNNARMENHGIHAKARFYVYRAFINYCADEYRNEQRRNQIITHHGESMLHEHISARDFRAAFMYMAEEFTDEEHTIALWRLRLLTEKQARQELGVSRPVLYRRWQDFRDKYCRE